MGAERRAEVQRINVDGIWLACRAVLPHMKERGYGRKPTPEEKRAPPYLTPWTQCTMGGETQGRPAYKARARPCPRTARPR